MVLAKSAMASPPICASPTRWAAPCHSWRMAERSVNSLDEAGMKAMRYVVLIALLASTTAQADDDFFEKQIRPLLVEHCFECHGDKKQEGGLRLISRRGAITGGDNGPAVAAGNPKESLLIHAVGYQEDLKMPPDGKLADERTGF